MHCPVKRDALVLEVGSGGNPFPRANVLLDAFEETRQRHWAPLVRDRPTVLGVVERLPFRDKVFDFVIACHVLEHSADPLAFLTELTRVANAGYIECPDAFMERVNPYRDHRLEVTVREAVLVIHIKASWLAEATTVELYEQRVKPLLTSEVIPRHPFVFHVRFYWESEIPFRIVNPETDGSWEAPASGEDAVAPDGTHRARGAARRVVSRLWEQRRRNRGIDLLALLRCPSCRNPELVRRGAGYFCPACERSYPDSGGIPFLRPAVAAG